MPFCRSANKEGQLVKLSCDNRNSGLVCGGDILFYVNFYIQHIIFAKVAC